MNKNKIINILLWCASALSVVLCIAVAIFAFNTVNLLTKIILIVVAVLFAALAAMVGYLAYMDTFKVFPSKNGAKIRPLNYFLNANGKKKGIDVEDLTFDTVDRQMNKFIIDTWGSPIALWQGNAFSDPSKFGKDGEFRILVAYKMIEDLQKHHSKKAWRMFFELTDADFADIQECFVRNGDEELIKALDMYRLTGEICAPEAAAFLDENATYIQRRMLNYVTRKIDSFDM